MRNCEPCFSYDIDIAFARKEITKYTVRVRANDAEKLWRRYRQHLQGCSGWKNPLHFIWSITPSILSLFCTLANPHHTGDVYLALDRAENMSKGIQSKSGQTNAEGAAIVKSGGDKMNGQE